MAKKRKLLNNALLNDLAGLLLALYYRVVMVSSAVRWQADPAVDQLVHGRKVPVIYVLWHCHLFFMPLLRPYGRSPLAVLVSSHRDARIAGVAARWLGVELVEGSSTRGGMKAYRQLLRSLRRGQPVCLTPDGPKGPARQVKPGVIQLACQSGCAVVPVAVGGSRQHRLRSWDGTVVPLPFGQLVVRLAAPIYLDRHGDQAEAQHALAVALDAAEEQARRALMPGPSV